MQRCLVAPQRLYGQLGQLYGDFRWSQRFFLYASHLMKEKSGHCSLCHCREPWFFYITKAIVHYANASFMRFVGSYVGLEEGGIVLLFGQVEKRAHRMKTRTRNCWLWASFQFKILAHHPSLHTCHFTIAVVRSQPCCLRFCSRAVLVVTGINSSCHVHCLPSVLSRELPCPQS